MPAKLSLNATSTFIIIYYVYKQFYEELILEAFIKCTSTYLKELLVSRKHAHLLAFSLVVSAFH